MTSFKFLYYFAVEVELLGRVFQCSCSICIFKPSCISEAFLSAPDLQPGVDSASCYLVPVSLVVGAGNFFVVLVQFLSWRSPVALYLGRGWGGGVFEKKTQQQQNTFPCGKYVQTDLTSEIFNTEAKGVFSISTVVRPIKRLLQYTSLSFCSFCSCINVKQQSGAMIQKYKEDHYI